MDTVLKLIKEKHENLKMFNLCEKKSGVLRSILCNNSEPKGATRNGDNRQRQTIKYYSYILQYVGKGFPRDIIHLLTTHSSKPLQAAVGPKCILFISV